MTKNQKLKLKFFLILFSVLTVFVVLERQFLRMNSSLVLANMTRDMTRYSGDPAWVIRYNEAIWLSGSGRYSEAKTLLAPLLNDTTITRRAEIAELYGDIIHTTSGTIDDTIRMYMRSLSFSSSDRVMAKIAYIKMLEQHNKNGSGAHENLRMTTRGVPKIDTGSVERETKKAELQKIAGNRDQYLGNSISSAGGTRSDLLRLIESIQSSGSIAVTQDW